MKSQDVLEIYKLLDSNGIELWIDGGWGVDALLVEQTRPHKDLDVVLEEKNVQKLTELLSENGYKNVTRDDTSPWNFVMGDNNGHQVDIHVFILDSEGNGWYGDRGLTYPAASFLGKGTIDGVEVKTISAEQIIKFVSPWLYKKRKKNIADMTALCDKFKIPYPPELKAVLN